jgi:hypothetical protein
MAKEPQFVRAHFSSDAGQGEGPEFLGNCPDRRDMQCRLLGASAPKLWLWLCHRFYDRKGQPSIRKSWRNGFLQGYKLANAGHTNCITLKDAINEYHRSGSGISDEEHHTISQKVRLLPSFRALLTTRVDAIQSR